MRIFLIFSLLAAFNIFAEKHPHRGIIKPYRAEPPMVELTEAERGTLKQNMPVYKTVEDPESGTGRAVAVFQVNAPSPLIWKLLSSFKFYPRWIDGVTRAEHYKKNQKNKNKGKDIFVEFRLQKFPIDYTYYIKHDYPTRQRDWGTWHLDYEKKSDLSDSVGFWRVVPSADNPNICTVTYSVEAAFFGYVPGFIKDMLKQKGLEQATVWVKREAEKRFKPRA